MSLEQAIEHAEDVAISAIGCECREEHKQLAEWLRELVERRKEPEIITGEWELKDHQWECNKCGCRINVKNPLCENDWNYYFCPHCGTKMIIAVQRF